MMNLSDLAKMMDTSLSQLKFMLGPEYDLDLRTISNIEGCLDIEIVRVP
jgi:hypothetical protein